MIHILLYKFILYTPPRFHRKLLCFIKIKFKVFTPTGFTGALHFIVYIYTLYSTGVSQEALYFILYTTTDILKKIENCPEKEKKKSLVGIQPYLMTDKMAPSLIMRKGVIFFSLLALQVVSPIQFIHTSIIQHFAQNPISPFQ